MTELDKAREAPSAILKTIDQELVECVSLSQNEPGDFLSALKSFVRREVRAILAEQGGGKSKGEPECTQDQSPEISSMGGSRQSPKPPTSSAASAAQMMSGIDHGKAATEPTTTPNTNAEAANGHGGSRAPTHKAPASEQGEGAGCEFTRYFLDANGVMSEHPAGAWVMIHEVRKALRTALADKEKAERERDEARTAHETTAESLHVYMRLYTEDHDRAETAEAELAEIRKREDEAYAALNWLWNGHNGRWKDHVAEGCLMQIESTLAILTDPKPELEAVERPTSERQPETAGPEDEGVTAGETAPSPAREPGAARSFGTWRAGRPAPAKANLSDRGIKPKGAANK